jgi:hypothetical protein
MSEVLHAEIIGYLAVVSRYQGLEEPVLPVGEVSQEKQAIKLNGTVNVFLCSWYNTRAIARHCWRIISAF